ncbi:MAG: phospholipid carrier-dependent glycosyltransferase [Anaerolineae bacterium]|nr:phospholipid carrier-dependent glycosyltransferase [Anaerolineae bacterium]
MSRRLGAEVQRCPPWAICVLLLLLFLLLISGAERISATADEFAYIAGGYALVSGEAGVLDMLTQRGYPPLMPAVQGALVHIGETDVVVADLAGWPDAFDVYVGSFHDALESPDRVLFMGRIPTIWLTVLMAAVAFRWARIAFGCPAGLIALGLLLVDPTLLAHGRLATTDGGIAGFGLASLYCAWRWTRLGGWRWALACGVLSGATLLTKASGPLWLGCAGILLVGGVVRRRRIESLSTTVPQVVAAVVVAFLILWAAYGFHWEPLGETGLSVPAPAYWRSAFYLTGYESVFFALGERQMQSWWWYFPLSFLIKNPLPLLLLWFTGMGVLMLDLPLGKPAGTRGTAYSRLALASLALFPAVYFTVAVAQGMNIGYRHLLPVHPLLHVAAAGGLAALWRGRALMWRWAIAGLGVWCAVVTLRMYPNEIAFFSVLAGGPTEGYRYLVDSNLDWGQDAYVLAQYLTEHPGVRHEPPSAKLSPAPGRYIIGASALQGVGCADSHAYEWFRHIEPVEQVDYSLLVYDVPEFAAQWVAQCADPLSPLAPVEIADGVGRDVREVSFDCTQSWLVPDGGATAGIYALSADLLQDSPREFPSMLLQPPSALAPALRSWLAPVRLSYLDREAPQAFALYEHTPAGRGAAQPPDTRLNGTDTTSLTWVPDITDWFYRVPVETPPNELAGANQCATCTSVDPNALTCPCSTDGPVDFLGVSMLPHDNVVDIETWWRVTATPITRNFSIMAHLVNSSGEALSTADGLGVWPTSLRTGDVFAQLHRFARPETKSQVWLRTGGYWLDTMERWQVGKDPFADAFLLRLDLAHDVVNGEP